MNLAALKALTLDRKAMFRAGGAGLLFVDLSAFHLDWPEGDPAGAREAAGYFRDIADRIDKSGRDMAHVAAVLGKHNKGKGIGAFETFFSEDMAPYPVDVAAYARNVAKVCDDYADLLERIQHALRVMLAIQLLEDAMFALWPEIRVGAYFMNKRLRAAAGGYMIRLLKYFIESSWYMVLDQAIKASVRGIAGDDLGTPYDIGKDATFNLIGALVFYHIDPANFGMGDRAYDKIWKRVAWYWAGSNLFSDTAGSLSNSDKLKENPLHFFDPSLDPLVQLRKLIMPFAQEPASGGGPKLWGSTVPVPPAP